MLKAVQKILMFVINVIKTSMAPNATSNTFVILKLVELLFFKATNFHSRLIHMVKFTHELKKASKVSILQVMLDLKIKRNKLG